MKKELFNEIFGLMKKLDIPFNIGTRTNVQKMPSVKDLTNNVLSEDLVRSHIDKDGVSKRSLKMFERDGVLYSSSLMTLEGQSIFRKFKSFR